MGQPDLGEQYLPFEYIAAPDQPPTNANLEPIIMHISEYFFSKIKSKPVHQIKSNALALVYLSFFRSLYLFLLVEGVVDCSVLSS